MKRVKRFAASMIISALIFTCLGLPGCGSNPTPIPTPTPTVLQQIEQYASIVGGLAAGLLPSLDGAQGAEIVATIRSICALKGSNGDPAALMALIQAQFQKLWLQIDASGISGVAIVAALNVLWAYVQTSVAGQDAATSLLYLNAAIDGICTGFGVPPATTFWQKVKHIVTLQWLLPKKAGCCR